MVRKLSSTWYIYPSINVVFCDMGSRKGGLVVDGALFQIECFFSENLIYLFCVIGIM